CCRLWQCGQRWRQGRQEGRAVYKARGTMAAGPTPSDLVASSTLERQRSGMVVSGLGRRGHRQCHTARVNYHPLTCSTSGYSSCPRLAPTHPFRQQNDHHRHHHGGRVGRNTTRAETTNERNSLSAKPINALVLCDRKVPSSKLIDETSF
ncbi:unnamed protein product, partial [Ectocarpus sp. 6 AP-2014]